MLENLIPLSVPPHTQESTWIVSIYLSDHFGEKGWRARLYSTVGLQKDTVESMVPTVYTFPFDSIQLPF